MSTVRAVALSALAIACAAACRRKVPPEERVDGWALARAALTSGEHCFAGRAEYCLTDPRFVDAAIQKRLDEIYGGEMPPRKVHVDAVIRAAAIRYKRETMRPENLAKVEELVKERYLNPRVATTDDTVSVDMGVVPGHLEGRPATLAIILEGSEVLDRGEWKRSELERVLLPQAEKHPDKAVLRVAVTLPTDRGLGTMVYRWLRDTRTLVLVDWTGQLRTTPRLDGPAALKERPASLRFFDLAPCEASRLSPPPDQDPPKLCPPDVDPAAPQPAP